MAWRTRKKPPHTSHRLRSSFHKMLLHPKWSWSKVSQKRQKADKQTRTVYFNFRNTCLKMTIKLLYLSIYPYPLRYSILYSIIDRNIEKESIREFINKKREMFYLEVQFVLTNKLLQMFCLFCSACFLKFLFISHFLSPSSSMLWQ